MSLPRQRWLPASRISGEEEQCYLVFDFGGGTLDVSVVDYFDNVIEIISVSGDNKLGGDDFDQIIARRFCGENQLDYEELEPRLEAYKMLPPGGIRIRLALVRGERLFAELCGERRRVVAQVMEGLQEAIYLGRSDQQMLKMCREAQEIYDRLERIRG